MMNPQKMNRLQRIRIHFNSERTRQLTRQKLKRLKHIMK